MRLAVHQKTAAAADSLAAVVFEADRSLPVADQLFIELIEGFQERQIRGDAIEGMAFVAAGLVAVCLPPDAQGELHR